MSHLQIKNNCLRLLARREYSQQELLHKMQQKGFLKQDIEKVVAELQQQGLQSDERFAKSYALMRFYKGFGSLKIAYELKQRGITQFNLKELIDENFTDEFNLVKKAYQVKFPHENHLSTSEKQKRQRFLSQRGFSYELIQKLFQSFIN